MKALRAPSGEIRYPVSKFPVIAIVGRPNVGKSALFNRLVGKRLAIVEPSPGATRDRLYAPVEWQGRTMTFVDTGGIDAAVHRARLERPSSVDDRAVVRPKADAGASAGSASAAAALDDIRAQTRMQAELAIREADVVVFVVDAQEGVMPGDADVADLLRPARAKVLLVANKVESPKTAGIIYEFCTLGFDVPLAVSAVHGLQSGDLLDAIAAKLPPDAAPEKPDDNAIHLAIVGQPNVGKSSLLNALAGRERVVVSPEPGTTRDAIDTAVELDGRRFVAIDTAGIRRHSNQGPALEYYSALRSVAAIGRSDVVLLLVDAVAGVTAQDRRIAGLALEEGKALAIMLNKWDLVDAETVDREAVAQRLRAEFAFAPYVPILYGSARTKKGLAKAYRTITAIFDERRKRIPTARLNHVVRDAFRLRPPAPFRGHELKCHYVTQSGVAPPEIVFFVNDPKLVHFSYERYLENALRASFGFDGTPLRFVFRPRVRQDATEAKDVIAAAVDENDAP